ncbi:MAG: AtpZ/AtpI family protein [Syntrophomonas sp.]|uniref:AtpZ/AtpI family protein n=1 Tax=Syntrophomonas sp. TaxID=2053627 RepID=UPI0026393C68|nr:AtpZ/AtpI family protein [Syntrophomonas sp.]MDD2509533.1 AtpZ/AtpI family protein [Syntrophomonas sp.]MDD3878404.1 AtpZ/AtpI family protein [Syntrophomonas sp.]MDD4625497.1 AtpZ/AtpI family protein [Syntrophomonas sp.]
MAEKGSKNWVRGLSDAVNLATTVAAAVAIGYFAGRWLDGKFDTEPWLTVAGFMLGVATGMKAMWEKSFPIKKSIKETKEKTSERDKE